MSRENVLNALRYAADQSLSVVDRYLGLNRSKVTLVLVENSGIDVFGEGGTKSRTDTRLSLGDGYVSTISFDGYINLNLEEVKSKDVFLSGGLLQDKDYVLGPIVFPYTYCQTSGGFDLGNFLPSKEEDTDIQLYFYIENSTFPNGAYFKRLYTETDEGLTYKVYLRNVGFNLIDIE